MAGMTAVLRLTGGDLGCLVIGCAAPVGTLGLAGFSRSMVRFSVGSGPSVLPSFLDSLDRNFFLHEGTLLNLLPSSYKSYCY